MNNLGDAKWILKMVIAEIEWRVNLDISKDLVMEVLSKFDMDQAKESKHIWEFISLKAATKIELKVQVKYMENIPYDLEHNVVNGWN